MWEGSGGHRPDGGRSGDGPVGSDDSARPAAQAGKDPPTAAGFRDESPSAWFIPLVPVTYPARIVRSSPSEPVAPPFPAFGLVEAERSPMGGHILSGWWIAPAGVVIDGLTTRVGDRELQAPHRVGQPSPDVAKAHPGLPGAERARFRVEVGASPEWDLANQLVSVVPRSGARTGTPLFTLVEPRVPLPRKEDLQVTGGAFRACYEFLGYFLTRAGLQPQHSVLEVGCGCGRMAYPLAYYLRPPGRYEGFDIVAHLVAAASSALTPTFPHVRFQAVDLWNSVYNPNGRLRASEFAFPYPEASFDLVFLTSVFTHMFPPDVRRYLAEIRRVLRPGGRVLLTAFLLTPESEGLIAAGRSSQPLIHVRPECKITKPEEPEAAVGFVREDFERWLRDARLEPIDHAPGFWCGRPRQASYQDLVIAARA